MANDVLIGMYSLDRLSPIVLGGDDIINIFDSMFGDISDQKYESVIVDSSLAGKPHLISKAVYGSQNYVDVLFGYNGYSNPLTIKAGDKLIIPPLIVLENMTKKNESPKKNESIAELKKRIPKQLKKRIEFLMRSKNNNGDIKTPNMNENGVNFTKQDDTIFLGSQQNTLLAVETTKNKIKNINNKK